MCPNHPKVTTFPFKHFLFKNPQKKSVPENEIESVDIDYEIDEEKHRRKLTLNVGE